MNGWRIDSITISSALHWSVTNQSQKAKAQSSCAWCWLCCLCLFVVGASSVQCFWCVSFICAGTPTQATRRQKEEGCSKCDANAETKKIVALVDVVIVAAVVSPLATQSLLSSAFHQREKGR